MWERQGSQGKGLIDLPITIYNWFINISAPTTSSSLQYLLVADKFVT
jgi:uncharacterized protein (DUF3820 family)